MPPYAQRQRALRARFPQLKADSILITNLPDVRYLCGFTGSNAALAITPKLSALFTDGRYTAQAKAEVQAARPVIATGSARKAALEWLAAKGGKRCFLDGATLTLEDFKQLEKFAKPSRIKLGMASATPVMQLRTVKDAFELARMREAALLGCELYYEALTFLIPGQSEVSVAAQLEYLARTRGAEKMAFDTIVASGTRSSLPHGHATSARLPQRGFVTLDFGVILNGYCSDMTRTVHIGKALPAQQAAYEAVLAAQEAAVGAVRPGVTCGEVDEAARSVLRQAKLDKWFSHSTGHGVGLEIHEPPRIGAGDNTPLEAGMVITIEPGVYLPGKFGIRIEDMVAVTPTGHEVLTPAPKGWTALA
jgi:Xaa-Pro aminopeptidase